MRRGRGSPRAPHCDTIERQYRSGMTLRELADLHGISKQAISKSLKRRGASPSFPEWRERCVRGQRAAASRRERKDRKGKE